jgi:hypothetical protein
MERLFQEGEEKQRRWNAFGLSHHKKKSKLLTEVYSMKQHKKIGLWLISITFALALAIPSLAVGKSPKELGKWMSGDFHQHTYYTDGSTTFDFVMMKNNQFGLDWWANSEHGGSRNRDGKGHLWTDPTYYPTNPIFGDVSGTPQVMWRWQSLRDFSFPDILDARDRYPDKLIFSGLEWNVPGHEHCSTGIVAKDASAISAFEFQFDKSDTDKSRAGEATPYGALVKRNGRDAITQATKPSGNDRHLDAVAACEWMQNQMNAGLIDNGWIVFAHIERAGGFKTGSSDGGYNVEHFRDFNNAGPDACFGFEGAPGHQVNYQGRGGFGTSAFGGTYGGVGFYTAAVGGLWDALLGEGRRWFNFASSDYHKHWTNCDDPTVKDSCGDDFYPGEYQKTWVSVDGAENHHRSPWQSGHSRRPLNQIVDGLRSGNSFFVMGDLIDRLEFFAQNGGGKAPMGGELSVNSYGGASKNMVKKDLTLTIKFRSPVVNNNDYAPVVNHLDLIAGDITGPIAPSSPDYTKATNESTKVIASFTAADWKQDVDGYNTIVYRIQGLQKSMYFRLRGTNLACAVQNETGLAVGLPSAEYCNPLADSLIDTSAGPGAQAKAAWKDLWFYSNPIFVYVK